VGQAHAGVGFVDGRPVGTPVAYLSDGIVGEYLAAVVPTMRRHWFREALTWRATSQALPIDDVRQGGIGLANRGLSQRL